MASIQAGGFNGGERSTDFSDGTKLGNTIAAEAVKTYLVGDTIGVTCVNWQPAPIAHDLCSVVDLCLSLLIEPSWQFFIPAMLSECIEDTMECEAQEVAQIAASAGLEANARINIIAIARKNFIMELLYHCELVSTSNCYPQLCMSALGRKQTLQKKA